MTQHTICDDFLISQNAVLEHLENMKIELFFPAATLVGCREEKFNFHVFQIKKSITFKIYAHLVPRLMSVISDTIFLGPDNHWVMVDGAETKKVDLEGRILLKRFSPEPQFYSPLPWKNSETLSVLYIEIVFLKVTSKMKSSKYTFSWMIVVF